MFFSEKIHLLWVSLDSRVCRVSRDLPREDVSEVQDVDGNDIQFKMV